MKKENKDISFLLSPTFFTRHLKCFGDTHFPLVLKFKQNLRILQLKASCKIANVYLTSRLYNNREFLF